MAVAEKKRMKAQLKADPLREMKDPERKFIMNNPVLKKKFVPITYSETLELDARKWSPKSLAEALYAVARYELQILATAVHQAVAKGDAKKAEKDLQGSYDRISKQVVQKVSHALEELKSDNGDNKKALKEGKDLFTDFSRVDFSKLFAKPTAAIGASLTTLVRDAAKAEANPAAFRKSQLAAQKVLKAEAAAFRKDAKSVGEALTAFEKLHKELRKNDDVAPELKQFGAILGKQEKVFDGLQDACEDYSKALDEIEKVLANDDLDESEAKTAFFAIRGQSGPEKAAKAAAVLVKKLKPQFLALQKKLK